MDSVSNETLATLLTHERLATYLKASNDDLTAALQPYNWNIDVTTAALAMTAMVEVPLRNVLDHQLTCWAHRRGSHSWFDLAPLDTQGRRDLAKATQRAGAGRRQPTHGRIVAELSFGFWRFLLSRRYLTTLWIPALQNAFTNTDLDATVSNGPSRTTSSSSTSFATGPRTMSPYCGVTSTTTSTELAAS